VSAVLEKLDGDPFNYAFYCPGCECDHGFNTDTAKKPCWTFNGDMIRPTISPSLLIRWGRGDKPPKVCHSFVRDGQIQFLADCAHKLAGKTVALEPQE
jgi:Family of unknown function (DUF6527)